MITKPRLESLDAFRGLTVAGMILVNNPGSWSYVYPPLRHAEWHGCTSTDLIFPFFLFIVGVSIHFAYQEKISEGLTKTVFWKIAKRALIIFGLGLLLTLVPNFNFETVRIPGVLQRISVVFFISSMLYFKLNWVSQIRLAAVLLLGYYVVMNFIPVPGIGDANLEKGTNLAAWLDSIVLEGHMWSQTRTWDPEGILSTIPAISTCMIGMLIGQLLSAKASENEKTIWLFLAGVALTILGLGWGLFFPMNKALWTSSFVLYTAGLACHGLAVMYFLIDVKGYSKWALPLRYYGMNAIFVFVASGLLAKMMGRIKVDAEGKVSVWSWIFKNVFDSWLPSHVASLAFAVCLILFFGFILRWMYNKKIFIKV
jgi:predicted acyltransferase